MGRTTSEQAFVETCRHGEVLTRAMLQKGISLHPPLKASYNQDGSEYIAALYAVKLGKVIKGVVTSPVLEVYPDGKLVAILDPKDPTRAIEGACSSTKNDKGNSKSNCLVFK